MCIRMFDTAVSPSRLVQDARFWNSDATYEVSIRTKRSYLNDKDLGEKDFCFASLLLKQVSKSRFDVLISKAVMRKHLRCKSKVRYILRFVLPTIDLSSLCLLDYQESLPHNCCCALLIVSGSLLTKYINYDFGSAASFCKANPSSTLKAMLLINSQL